MSSHIALARRRSLMFCVASLWLALGGTALADSASISVTTTAGQSDPAAQVPRTFTLKGNVAAPKNYYVRYRATGGAPCAGSADADTGDAFGGWYGGSANGNFEDTQALTWDRPGSYQFCIWLADDRYEVVTPISQVITFRSPGGTISATLDPPVPRPGQVTRVAITGSSEAEKNVYARIRGAGSPGCAPTAGADNGSSLIYGDPVNGAFALPTTMTIERAGDYIMCLWLADSDEDAAPVAGPQPIPFSVVAPPRPACVVPFIRKGSTVRTAKRKLKKARCKMRTVKRRSRVRRGRVIKTRVPAGTRLRNGAKVGVLVSRGRR